MHQLLHRGAGHQEDGLLELLDVLQVRLEGVDRGYAVIGYAHDFGTWSEAEGRLVNRRPHVWEKRI